MKKKSLLPSAGLSIHSISGSISGSVLSFFFTWHFFPSCCFLKNKAIPHRLDVGFAPSFSPIKGESPSSLNHTSPLHLRIFVVLPNCFGDLLFASISLEIDLWSYVCIFSFISGSCSLTPEDVGYCRTS